MGRSEGFFPLENPAYVGADHAIVLVGIRSIAHQTAGGSELAPKIEGRHPVAHRQHNELRRADEKERVGSDEQRIGAHLGDAGKGRVNVTNGAGFQDSRLLPDGASGGLHSIDLCFSERLVRISQAARWCWHRAIAHGRAPVPVGNLRPEILMVQSTQNWHRQRATDGLDGTRDRRVLVQR